MDSDHHIEVVSEAFWTGTGWKGQAVQIDFTSARFKILWETPNEYGEEDVAHLAVKKWGRQYSDYPVRRVREAECNER